MKDATHLVRRGAVYYFRARVPAAIQLQFGKEFVVVSLRTKDRAEAKVRAFEQSAQLEREYLRLRSQVPVATLRGKRAFLSDADIEHICAYERNHILHADLHQRMGGMDEGDVQFTGELFGSWLEKVVPALARGDTTVTRGALDETLARLEIDVSRESPSFKHLEYKFLAAHVEACSDVMRRQRGEVVATPQPPKSRRSLDGLVEYWAKQTGPIPATLADFRQVFAKFRSLFPAIAADDVRKHHVVSYRDHLVEKKRAPKTVQRHINHLHAVFQIAADSELIEFNPASGVRPPLTKSRKKSSKSRLPFTIEQLNKIFYSDIYTKGARPKGGGGDAAYWLPLLALWTGARLEELAQLVPDDIRDERGPGPYIDVNDEGDEKGLKNVPSVRRVPIHTQLLRIGFMKYVAARKSAKDEYLFPELVPDIKKNRSGNFSKWFGRHLDSLGITDSRMVFHSFRHGFVDACREVTNPEIRDALVGHSNKSVSEEYGTGRYPLPPLFEALNRVTYKGLKLTHLQKQVRAQR